MNAPLLRPALVLLGFFSVVCGLAYPAVITAIAQAAFPREANGSLVLVDGKPVGSSLIGQAFHAPGYFWGRPSASTPPYNGAASSGSNLGPTNPALRQAVAERVAAAGPAAGPVPVDLVTASASGLDPDISLAAALFQVPRVAKARNLDERRLAAIVADLATRSPIAAARVNVLALNLALMREQPQR